MARNDPQVNLRIPAELKAQIDEAAKAGNRSMNAEIVARLQQSFEGGSVDAIETGTLIGALLKRFPPELIQIRIGPEEKDEDD